MWVGSAVQIQEKGSSAAGIGFYFLPESLFLSLIESNQKVAALGPPSHAAGSVHGLVCTDHRAGYGWWEIRLGR